jgi:hypothetical protein
MFNGGSISCSHNVVAAPGVSSVLGVVYTRTWPRSRAPSGMSTAARA